MAHDTTSHITNDLVDWIMDATNNLELVLPSDTATAQTDDWSMSRAVEVPSYPVVYWQLCVDVAPKVDNWLSKKYAWCQNADCYYYHVIFQLCNTVVRLCLRLDHHVVQEMRYKIYGNNKKRQLIMHDYCLLQKIYRYFSQSKMLDKTCVENVIYKIRQQTARWGFLEEYMRHFRHMTSELVRHNPDLASELFQEITGKIN